MKEKKEKLNNSQVKVMQLLWETGATTAKTLCLISKILYSDTLSPHFFTIIILQQSANITVNLRHGFRHFDEPFFWNVRKNGQKPSFSKWSLPAIFLLVSYCG